MQSTPPFDMNFKLCATRPDSRVSLRFAPQMHLSVHWHSRAIIYHRVQMEHGDPDNDPRVECTTNWMRRRRTRRFNTPGNTHPGGFSAPDATTGNILAEPF